jgi:hypothetical protein
MADRRMRNTDVHIRLSMTLVAPVRPAWPVAAAKERPDRPLVWDAATRDKSMPIKIPDDLSARATLNAEGLMVMREADAVRQDIRPMRIGLLNLMPDKIKTELKASNAAISASGCVSRTGPTRG